MRTKSHSASLVVLVALVVSMLPGSAGAQLRLANVPPVAVKIALAAPLTAGATVLGQGMDRGTQLAIADYASALASAGVSVSEVAADDQGDPSVAVAAAGSIVSDSQILGVVGHLNSGCSIPASKVYSLAHVAMISPASTNPALTQQGLDNVFRDVGTDAGQGIYAADICVRNLRLTKAYVVDDSTPYGAGLASKFGWRLKKDGGKVVGSAKTSDADTDFKRLVKKIKAKNPQVVFYGGIYNAGAIFTKQLKAKLPNVQILGADGLFDTQFVKIAGASKASGALASNVGLDTNKMIGGVAFAQRYAALFPGQPVGPYDAYAYDAASAILKAIIAVANESSPTALLSPGAREQVRAKVASSTFTGVSGLVAFNSAGDTLNPSFSVYRVKSGAWRQCADVGRPSTPSSVKRNAVFVAAGSLSPHFGPGSNSVTLLFYYHGSRKYSLLKSAKATISNSGQFSKYAAAVRLPKSGTWFVVAEQEDGSHGRMDSTQKYLAVK